MQLALSVNRWLLHEFIQPLLTLALPPPSPVTPSFTPYIKESNLVRFKPVTDSSQQVPPEGEQVGEMTVWGWKGPQRSHPVQPPSEAGSARFKPSQTTPASQLCQTTASPDPAPALAARPAAGKARGSRQPRPCSCQRLSPAGSRAPGRGRVPATEEGKTPSVHISLSTG